MSKSAKQTRPNNSLNLLMLSEIPQTSHQHLPQPLQVKRLARRLGVLPARPVPSFGWPTARVRARAQVLEHKVQVRVLEERGELVTRDGTVDLAKNTVHLLWRDEAQPLITEGVVEMVL